MENETSEKEDNPTETEECDADEEVDTLSSGSEDYTLDTETRECRTFLRQKFLRFIAAVSNEISAEIDMYENTSVHCNIISFDSEMENVVVEHLQTPYLPVNKAILRTGDIITIKFQNVKLNE